ncbi:TMhelix containing protein [Vibrio phage 1.284.A._10N.286.55.A5]|nr:TMhelix containing protein [Vibrio phage 1.284.A._10N.286.55.A5]
MFEFIGDNYWEIAAVCAILYMILFMIANKVFNEQYSAGVIILAIVLSTLAWPLSVPYFVIGTIIDKAFK